MSPKLLSTVIGGALFGGMVLLIEPLPRGRWWGAMVCLFVYGMFRYAEGRLSTRA